ncbi:hypothetical protein TBLA_0B08930 [Henningerozyma blattae CBS 6284]|uniref:Anaphase-promoting complex subunit 4 WD40 domain-containing protein n=1 Tax=Henningerozyma blattae (strain ATCC 34711 / CBS 6284 / DSM 70876 / NBRC 10599 / NRRL Y-10934 / UCD 77-7) TaxID=1071380 RepID=I2H006_HENB6|nr:hypothetical protein TBLA_0B08930 [Tetrapisispora blattae CBS 6284]CCH59708.1 hypothetical protein TBLA_0B08930 [Tetrapisispora blattae CBS 6284]
MPSIQLKSIIPPQPSTERNFTTHLSYNESTNSIAYPSGKSAFIRSLDPTTPDVIQFTGHGSSNVTVVKFSPNSQYICSGDESGKAIVWSWFKENDVIEFNIKSEFQVLAGRINDISWDFESKRLCIVGEGRDKFGTFISWDSGNSLGEISGHSQKINACHFKQSRPMRAVTVSDDSSVVFYEGPPFKFSSSDRSHHDNGKFIRDVKFSPNEGEFFISVGSDRKIACFNGKTGEFIKLIQDENDPVQGGIFALSWVNTTQFVTASADATVRLWDVNESKVLQKWTSPEPTLNNQQVGVVVAKDNTIISLELDGTLNFFQIGQERLVKKIRGHQKAITSLAVSPLITGSYDGKIMSWSPKTQSFDQHNNLIISIDNSNPDGFSSVSWDDTLKRNGKTLYNFESQPKIAASNKDGILAIVTMDNTLLVLQSDTGSKLNSLQLKEPCSSVTISSKLIAVGYESSKNVEIFNATDLSVSHLLKNTPTNVSSYLSISPNEKFIAVGDVMGKIILYDMETRDVKTSRWAFHTSRITDIDWLTAEEGADDDDDDDEGFVVTGSLDTNIIIYSVKRPMKNIKYLNAHKEGINSIKWDGKDTFVSVGKDSCIKNWKVDFD